MPLQNNLEPYHIGSSPELMPSIMGAFDAIVGTQTKENEADVEVKTSTPKRSHQANNFSNLSPRVQKILSNVPDQEISKKFSSEETLGPRRFSSKPTYRSFRSPEKCLNKSNESLEVISSNVQKMLSNLPDTELVISASTMNLSRNSSYLFNSASRGEFLNKLLSEGDSNGAVTNGGKQFLYYSDENSKENVYAAAGEESDVCDGEKCENCDSYSQKPLGSYLHSPQGIASRTPVGRKNMGKYLQVPSESSTGNTNSTTSSEVSRPVSLTSLGSCSSSGSSGHHQPGSAYLASAESLDSDPEPAGSQGSADSGIAEQEQPTMSPEQRVLQEVLETETVYVSDLNEVIQGYLEPWKADSDCPLAQHLQHLFSNLEEIYKFNRSFLEDLKIANCEATKIANCFLHHDLGFSVYNEYCQNYPRTMEILGQLTKDETMASLFRERQFALGHALPLGSYLLKPVQRILKYHLLLQRLSKQCDPVHKPAVDLALTTMTGIASDINNMKRKHEHAVRVQEIQSQLYSWNGPDLTTVGELIAEGTFRVVGARGRRHVFLFEKMFVLAKSKQGGALAYKSHIDCSSLMLVEQVRGEPLSFQVISFDNPRHQSTLKARSPQHKRDWTLQIKQVILENYSAVIPKHARQLVLQLGQDLNENEDVNNDKWSPLRQNSTPQYLERRSRLRKTRDFTNRRASSQDRSILSPGNWRRKSEPSMIPQYNSKTMPKKITKLKKAKEFKSATFYTDLSDSENFEVVGESLECLPQNNSELTADEQAKQHQRSDDRVKNNIEKIVSDILMENQTFNKALSRPNTRKNATNDPTMVWYDDKLKVPAKSDSLPRSFQLNDQIDSIDGGLDCRNERLMHDMSLKENPDIDVEEQQENDLSSQLDDTEHPEHKIYRKSAMRFSILHRIRHLLLEDQKRQKYPLHKQGSKSMGEKIAHPDYVDPQKLFSVSRNCSQYDLSENKNEVCDVMGEPEHLDLTINEKDVLNEIEKRLNGGTNNTDTGQKSFNSSHSTTKSECSKNSSQNSDSYYESILEDSLTEEYVRDSSGKMVAKQDSFSSSESKISFTQRYQAFEKFSSSSTEKRPIIKRPTKAPPPIPLKPARLSASNTSSLKVSSGTTTTSKTVSQTASSSNESCSQREVSNSTSWVKTMVGRFE
ncbi:guanine nucleotide exchange factor in mesoderm isoform X3 [Leptinotarsa decemlineata]|uniref:guanine nucleotide exchange factor in mesoderm isoform X3 n=1 Tax=Leptinotarsa decemlineata TaxID=7539 RepID=UPI003D305708